MPCACSTELRSAAAHVRVPDVGRDNQVDSRACSAELHSAGARLLVPDVGRDLRAPQQAEHPLRLRLLLRLLRILRRRRLPAVAAPPLLRRPAICARAAQGAEEEL